MEQSGLIAGIRPKDYVKGVNSPLAGKPINKKGDWRPWKPLEEKQYSPIFDSMSCSTFSGSSDFEALSNFFKQEIKKFSEAQIKWLNENGYLEGGIFNFSDRFSAIMSGTTPNGNYIQNVWDSFRNVGLIPERDLPFGGNSVEEYLDKKVITQAMLDKAKKFLEVMIVKDENGKYKINYELMVSPTEAQIEEALKEAPLQVAVTSENPRHAIDIFEKQWEWETYPPFLRRRKRTVAYALKPIVEFTSDVPATPSVSVYKGYKPPNFTLEELVPLEVIKRLGEKAWELLDARMTRNLQFFRDTFGPTIVNTPSQQYRCFDPSAFRKEGTSQHNAGRASDCTFKNYTSEQVREWLRIPENASKVPYPDIWVELGTPHFHFDVRYSDKKGVYFFNP